MAQPIYDDVMKAIDLHMIMMIQACLFIIRICVMADTHVALVLVHRGLNSLLIWFIKTEVIICGSF